MARPGTILSLRKRLLRDSNASIRPVSTTDLGFAGFLFSLLKPMLGVGSDPSIRQQGFQGGGVAGDNGRNPTKHVGQVRMSLVSSNPRIQLTTGRKAGDLLTVT